MGTGYQKLVMLAAVLLAVSIVSGAVSLLLRSDDNPPTQVLIPLEPEQPGGPQNSMDSEIKVYVSGAVVRPGVYQLEPGDRLVDALEKAGGAAQGAQLEAINLSLRVIDQDHYHFPRLGEVPANASGSLTPPHTQGSVPSNGYVGETAVIRTTSEDGRIDLNTAPPELLETLPGIGPVLAKAIIDYRESNRGFQTVEEVTNVSRIGPITYQKIRDLVTVSPVR